MTLSVAAIIPTYNYGRFIAETLESVLRQTYPIAEIIIVDDGSTDGTEEVVRGFGSNVTYLKQNNAGVCAARNLGVAHAKTEYVSLLDADDIWLPDKIAKQAAKFEENPNLGLVHCGMREFASDTGETLHLHDQGMEGWVAEKLALWEETVIVGPGGTIMLPKRVYEDVGGFDTRIKIGEDWDFCLRVAKKYEIGFVNEPLVEYRNHGVNAHTNVAEMERSTAIAWAKAFNTRDENLLKIKRRSYGHLYKVLAGSYLQSGNYGGFARNFVKSLWFRPAYLRYYVSLLLGSKGEAGVRK